MSILELLGFRRGQADDSASEGPLAAIERRVESLGAERAPLVAAFAAVLVRAARADLHVSEVETGRMVEAVRDFGEVDEETARLVVDVAAELSTAQGTGHDYLATRELRRLASPAERERALHCLFAVCAADDSISLVEEEEVRQVASELGFEHQDYVRARAAFSDRREVLRGLHRRS